MSPDTPSWWIPALIAGAALLSFFVLRARSRAGQRDEEASAPPPPPRRKPKRAPKPSVAPSADAPPERAPIATVEHASGPLVAVVDLVPGELVVNVVAHALNGSQGAVDCWSYVSDGLWTLGQKEIVITVQRRKGEARGAFPHDLLELYAIIHHFAAQGRLVDVGAATTLPPGKGLLGRSDLRGVLYAPPQVLPGVRAKAPWLTGLILTQGEVEVAQQLGVVRLMARLGKHYRYFPTAPWIDRDRPELCSPGTMQDSLVAKSPRLCLHAASVRQESRTASREGHAGPGGVVDQTVTFAPGSPRIVLRLRPGAAGPLEKALATFPADSVMALLVGPDPGAPACLAWEPGQRDPFAISKPDVSGDCIAGSFLAFVPQQKEDGGMLFEDGFVALLTDESWQRIRAALTGGQPLFLPATGEKLGLEIVWLPELDPDYADPLGSQVPGGWATFGGNQASAAPVLVKSISLLTIVDVLERRVETETLSAYIKEIDDEATSSLKNATAGPGQDLALECEVRPDGGRTFTFSVRPGKADDALEGLHERLMALPPPPVVGRIRFQLNIQLRGGSGKKKVEELN